MKSIKRLAALNYSFKKHFLIGIFCFFCLTFLPAVIVRADTAGSHCSLKVISDYCTLYFEGGANPARIDKKLDMKYIEIGYAGKRSLREAGDVFERVAIKCDMILLRSEQILDMYPADFHVNIVFFKSTKMLIDAYEEIMGERLDLYSFYVYENNTIYTTESRVNQNVLAHEIGHALVNHYFIVRPPATVRELLSQYIDVHLED